MLVNPTQQTLYLPSSVTTLGIDPPSHGSIPIDTVLDLKAKYLVVDSCTLRVNA